MADGFVQEEKRTALEIIEILGGCEVVINNWVKRFEAEGIKGLETRPGRGRKAILEKTDLAIVRAAVTENRQRIVQAKAELESNLAKQFSSGNGLAKIEIRMADSIRLRVEGTFAVCRQTSTFGIWKKFENKIFNFQIWFNLIVNHYLIRDSCNSTVPFTLKLCVAK